MKLNLASIISQPGGKVPFSITMDFSQMDFGGSRPASEPVLVQGQVRNEAGVLILTAAITTTLHCICDRCAAPFTRGFSRDVEAILVTELAHEQNEDDWTFLLSGDEADLDDIMTTAFVLNMDSKMLCSADCKGLCATCGKNLNEGPCDCRKELDPRLAVLKQLLKDKE
ncbi:MAG: DUF177 domain-containing protein [Oscillospiraceae bacterium]|nr:DUF177 domain-containing protein [Oscillospiraceae bacterium]